MSYTYVFATIKANTFGRTNEESLYIAQTVVNHLPKIVGEEHNADIYVNLAQGYYDFSSHDEFGKYSNLGNYNFINNKRYDFKYQSDVIISVCGNLRFRTFDETLRDSIRFMNRLSKRLIIEGGVFKITNYYNQEIDIMKNKCWQDNFDYDNRWINKIRRQE
jgi:hypothetical protein